MKPTRLINIVFSALILLTLNSCAALSQEGNSGDTPPEFRPAIGKWVRNGTGWAGRGSVEIIEIKSIKPNGEVDASFSLNFEGPLQSSHQKMHYWINIAEASATRPITEGEDIKLFLKIGDRTYSWSHYQFVLQDRVLSGEGFYIPLGRMIRVNFYRQTHN